MSDPLCGTYQLRMINLAGLQPKRSCNLLAHRIQIDVALNVSGHATANLEGSETINTYMVSMAQYHWLQSKQLCQSIHYHLRLSF